MSKGLSSGVRSDPGSVTSRRESPVSLGLHFLDCEMGTAPIGMLSRLNTSKELGHDTWSRVGAQEMVALIVIIISTHHMGAQHMALRRLMEERRGCMDHYHGGPEGRVVCGVQSRGLAPSLPRRVT